MVFQFGTPVRVALLLSAVIYMTIPDESSGLGMWGDFSRHTQISRTRARENAEKGDGVWVDDDLLSSGVNRSGEVKEQKVNIRKRRYVTFPEGSSSSLAICLSLGVSDTNLIFTHGLGYGISFELPNDTKALRGEGKATGNKEARELRSLDMENDFPAKRRDRRTLYQRIEEALNTFGIDGRACILRTLCEAAQRLAPKGGLMQEFVRIIFTMPQLDGRYSWEERGLYEDINKDYDKAHLHGKNNPYHNCEFHFPGCQFSLLQYLIG